MQIKQFSGTTIDEVLDQVRAELGEEAVILQTKRVVRGGLGGFFGREGIEVTAAQDLPAGEGEAANREAAASVAPAPAAASEVDAPPAPTAFHRHLEGRLAAAEEAEDDPVMADLGPAASPAAAYARASAPARPFAPGDAERSRAIIEAARAAVREAHARAAEPVDALDESAPAPFVSVAAPAPAAAPARAERPPARGSLDSVRSELLRAGVDERHLDAFLQGFARSVAPFLDARAPLREAVKDYLSARLPVVRAWKPRPAGHTIAFVGQSGVGKTSAVAKIAGRYRAAGLAVAIVAAGPGPHDGLEGHARRLDVQLFRAPDGAALADATALLADRDLILIDTDGRPHRREDEMRQLGALVAPARPDEVHLVLPAATAPADLGDLLRRFRVAGVNRITISKLDETRLLGNLVNIPLRAGKPLAYLADGPAVPDALAPADARRIAELLLP